jgi:hypothetical protein
MAVNQYRYLFADLVTNTINAELPLTGVTFGQNLNSAGDFSGHLIITDRRETAYDILTYTTPGKTALYIDRNGVLVWGGIIWSRTYNSTTQKLSLAGREFESYFEHRRVGTTNVFTPGTDQLAVAQTLVTQAQAVAYGNIGVIVGSETSGKTLTNFYPIFDYEHRPVFDAVRELSAQSLPYGYDFNIDVAYDGSNVPTKTLKLDYPQRGTVYGPTLATAPLLELPGQIVEYEYPEDGNTMSNVIYGYGAGSPPGTYQATAIDNSKLAAGFPLLENTANFSNIYDPNVVNNLTAGQVAAQSSPIVVMKITWDAYNTPTLGDFKTGDDFRIRITDARFPTGFDDNVRLTRYDVTVGESGPERITASFTYTQN